MVDVVKRSAREELGIQLSNIEFLGNYELFTKVRHYITHAYCAKYRMGTIKLDSHSNKFVIADIYALPKPIIPIQKRIIKDFTRKKNLLGKRNIII